MADDPIIELDVNDFAEEVIADEQQAAIEESSTEETTEVEVEEQAEAETPEEESEPEAEAEEAEEPEEAPLSEADKRKEQLNTEIRDLVSKRNEIRQEVERLNQVYQPPTAQELVDQGYSPDEARLAALEQRQEATEFNYRVTELNTVLQTESQRALQDFQWANPESPTYNEVLANQVAGLYQQAAGLQTDPNTGLVISANVTPYNFYKTFNDAIASTAIESQVKGQKATEKMLAAVDTPSNVAPKEVKEDPFLIGLTKQI